MIFWLETLTQGILLGGLYALYAAGLSLVFGVMRLVNLAHGDMIILTAYAILAASGFAGLHPFAAALVAMPVAFAFGWLVQRHVFNRALGADILPPLLVSFGLSIVLQNLLLELYSADSQRLSAGGLDTATLPLGPFSIGVLPLATFGLAVAVIIALNWLIHHTTLGRAMRATSDDPTTARLMGIRTQSVFAATMALALVVCVVAALCLGLRSSFDPSVGPARLIYAFEAVIIGGLGSLWGTLVGGVILGVAQTVGSAINPEWQILSGHLAFLAVLAFRPRGLFPRRTD